MLAHEVACAYWQANILASAMLAFTYLYAQLATFAMNDVKATSLLPVPMSG